MSVRNIILGYLKEYKYAGLCNDEGGCTIEDFMPCGGEYVDECEPAYKVDVPKGIDAEGDVELFQNKDACEEKKRYYEELIKERENVQE